MWTKEQVGTGSHSSPCPLAADQSFKSPRVKGQSQTGIYGSHFLAGALKEAGEARKRKPQPATTGTSQRSVERQGGTGASHRVGLRLGRADGGMHHPVKTRVNREVTGHSRKM